MSYGSTEHWVFMCGGGGGDPSAHMAAVVKIVLNSNLNAIQSITMYWYAGATLGSANGETVIRRGELYKLDNGYMLLIAHEPNTLTKNIRYVLVRRSDGAMTTIATHPFPDDFDFQQSVRRSALFITTRDTYIIVNYYATKTQTDGGTRFVANKLVFNNTFTNFVNQHRSAGAFYGQPSSTIWHVFVPTSPQRVQIIIPNVIAGNYIVTVFKISLDNTDNPEVPNIITVDSVEHDPDPWKPFTYRSTSSTVRKVKLNDQWIAELYNSVCRLFFGLPAFYRTLSAEMLNETAAWWSKDSIARDVTYLIYIKALADGNPLRNALVEFYDNSTGALARRTYTYTNANGVAAMAVNYGLGLKSDAIEILINVTYAGESIATFHKVFALKLAEYVIQLAIVDAANYDPNRIDYNFSQDVPTTLKKNVNYVFIYRIMKEGVEPALCNLMLRLRFDDLEHTATGKTDSNGIFKIGLVTAANIFKITVEAYSENVKVAERTDVFFMVVDAEQGADHQRYALPSISSFVFTNIVNLLPPLLIILVPAFAFYTVISDYRGLLIGLNVGIIIAVAVGLIPVHLLLLLLLVDALAFVMVRRAE
ncbi:MAG: hypothetical protein QXE92_03450 [Thermofilaceae archaeon]